MTSDAVRLAPLEISDAAVAEAVLELQQRSYAVEAKLIGSDQIPPLHERVEDLQACGESFVGAFVAERLAGVVSYTFDGTTIDVHRLAVDPESFRRGIARALVRAAIEAAPRAARVIVQTGTANEPAKQLYRAEGFSELGDCEVIPGLWITRFERVLVRPRSPAAPVRTDP